MIWYSADALYCSELAEAPAACYAAEDNRCHCNYNVPYNLTASAQPPCSFNDTRCSIDNWIGCEDVYTGIMLPWDYSGSACFSTGSARGGSRGFLSTCAVAGGLGWSLGLALLILYRRKCSTVHPADAAGHGGGHMQMQMQMQGQGQGHRHGAGYVVVVQGEVIADEDMDRMMSQEQKSKAANASTSAGAGGLNEAPGLPIASPI